MRFLHTADWQIGMKAVHVGDFGNKVREQRLESARQVIQIAIDHDVDFLVLAGDTFEDHGVSSTVVQKVIDILGKFPRPIFLLPGNHDPFVASSVWNHLGWRSFPQITILEETKEYEVPGGVLLAAPLKSKTSLVDPTAALSRYAGNRIAIGVAHGSFDCLPENPGDFRIAKDAAERLGVDYLALGHWHSTVVFPDSTGVHRSAYSGTHEPTKFGERDSGQVLLVEIETPKGTPKITQVRSGRYQWEVWDRTVSTNEDLERIVRSIEEHSQPSDTLVDLRLSGVFDIRNEVTLRRIEELLRVRFAYARIDTEPMRELPTGDEWMESLGQGVIAETARRLSALAKGEAGYEGAPSAATVRRAMIELFRVVKE